MKLTDSIAADIATVIDLDDFAEAAVVEGREIAAQFDYERLAELSGGAQLAMGLDGTVMYARTADLPRRRKPGDALMVNGRDMTVLSWEDRAGVSEVALQRSE